MNNRLESWAIAVTVWFSAFSAPAEERLKRTWIKGPPPNIEPGTTTIAVLPDTEYYAQKYPELFYAQTRWIADEAKPRNIAYTLHLGDITQHNNHEQWTVARKSFAMLDGLVPYALVPGNDDYDDLVDDNWNRLRESSRINDYFNPETISKWPTFGGFHQPGRLENTFHLFRIQQRDWMILCLEMGPRDEIVQWAHRILKQHAHRRTIVVTHAYLFRHNKRYDHRNGRERASPHPWGNDGEELWQKLLKQHANVKIVISGHVSTGGIGYRTDVGDHGNVVHQMMCDYQKKEKGGLAYMRLLEFAPDDTTVQVRTYSPYRKKMQISDLEDFTFTIKD
ncbi:MAG: metallophosphoesterase [Verrucomicrobiota bacterium]